MTGIRLTLNALAATVLAVFLVGGTVATMSGCESLPGDRGTQGAVIGGVGGAALGALIASENRLLGALIGGALGAGGGYLIGAETDWFESDDEEVREEANRAARSARQSPATAAQARAAATADINNDGFVTLDEVVAMENAGFSDQAMLDRLEATGQVFDLNEEQRQYLIDRGVSRDVVNNMTEINRQTRDRLLREREERMGSEVIGEER